MWNNETEAEFDSLKGVPMLQTHLQALEHLVVSIFSRQVFFIFRSLLLKCPAFKVVAWKKTMSNVIYVVRNSYCPKNNDI